MSGESFDKKNFEGYLDFLIALRANNFLILGNKTLLKEIVDAVDKYIEDKEFCLKVLTFLNPNIDSKEGKHILPFNIVPSFI